MSKELDPTEYMAAAERVLTPEQKDAIARDLALQEWQQRPGKPPGSTTTRYPRFKYATRTLNKRGNYLSSDCFDIPPGDIWNSGDIDVFEELMTLIKSGNDGVMVRDVICDAVKKMDDEPNGLTQKWLAVGFLNMVSEAIRFFATNAKWSDWLEDKRAKTAASKKHADERQRDHMAMMTRKSADARQAKKLAKQLARDEVQS